MTFGRRAVSVAGVANAVALVAVLGGACGSFSETTVGGAESGASENGGNLEGAAPEGSAIDGASLADLDGCPSRVVFSDGFDGAMPDKTKWQYDLSGSGMIAGATPGKFIAAVSDQSGAAALYRSVALEPRAARSCVAFALSIAANTGGFSGGGYVSTIQSDLYAEPGDSTGAFFGLGVDVNGVFTNVRGSSGQFHQQRQDISLSSAVSRSLVYRIERQGAGSLVTILLDHAVVDTSTIDLAQVGQVSLNFGASTGAPGTFSPVTMTFDSVVVTAE
jgi:hypothetical protein